MEVSLDLFPYEVVLEKLQKRSVEKMKSGISQISYDLLMKIIDLHFDRHLPHHPDRLTFNMVLSTLSRECTEEAAEKAMVSAYFFIAFVSLFKQTLNKSFYSMVIRYC